MRVFDVCAPSFTRPLYSPYFIHSVTALPWWCKLFLPLGGVTLVNLQRQLAMIRCCAKTLVVKHKNPRVSKLANEYWHVPEPQTSSAVRGSKSSAAIPAMVVMAADRSPGNKAKGQQEDNRSGKSRGAKSLGTSRYLAVLYHHGSWKTCKLCQQRTEKIPNYNSEGRIKTAENIRNYVAQFNCHNDTLLNCYDDTVYWL